jgi:hypothetical protein
MKPHTIRSALFILKLGSRKMCSKFQAASDLSAEINLSQMTMRGMSMGPTADLGLTEHRKSKHVSTGIRNQTGRCLSP